MKIVVWIIQIILVMAFLAAGFMKLVTPYPELIADPNMGWANDFSPILVKLIGAIEVLGALGLIIPMFVQSLRKLVPLAAIGLALTMIGAASTHVIRGEPVIIPLVLMVLCLFLARMRFSFLKN